MFDDTDLVIFSKKLTISWNYGLKNNGKLFCKRFRRGVMFVPPTLRWQVCGKWF